MSEIIDKIYNLQSEMVKLPQVELQTKHLFHGGMYCREVFRNAGVVIVGKVHKKEHLYMIVSGTVTVNTNEEIKTITGPCIIPSKIGTKRVVYAETDAICMTIHRTDATTLEEVEEDLVEDDPESMFIIGNIVKTRQLENQS